MMIKPISQILIVVFAFVSCKSDSNVIDCAKYKSGKFIFYEKRSDVPERINFLVERDGADQKETNLKTGDVTNFKVKWNSDCEYQLQLLKSTDKQLDSMAQYTNDVKMKTTIIEVTADYYLFEVKTATSDYVFRDTLWVKK
jgi:hypothetical protein